MDRDNHYETAFEAYLRDRRLGYVAVDESRRASLEDEPVKSIDFIVYGLGGSKLLVDIKGRQFPGTSKGRPRRIWQNWVERDDVEGLERWQASFGPEYQASWCSPTTSCPMWSCAAERRTSGSGAVVGI
jgi:hypothetical protein